MAIDIIDRDGPGQGSLDGLVEELWISKQF